jgi:hypothetical protein
MNSKSLQYSNIANPKLEKIAATQTSFITAVIEKLASFLTRSEIDKAQARYKAKLNAQAGSQQDMVRGLPVEEKLRLGMYRFMD